ncbi:hypothetical protein DPMN_032792 [Dreissena polymorpha]|uniref:Uncharacterized protein n=1 Tax=Dreissena polymorpha TaxID=45954 RepID=A0A9D4RJ89_DREPO|nr:hypothetical protein DPMN_032792 [Dreissena polymorpha]
MSKSDRGDDASGRRDAEVKSHNPRNQLIKMDWQRPLTSCKVEKYGNAAHNKGKEDSAHTEGHYNTAALKDTKMQEELKVIEELLEKKIIEKRNKKPERQSEVDQTLPGDTQQASTCKLTRESTIDKRTDNQIKGELIHPLFTKIWEEEEIPTEWKDSYIVEVSKIWEEGEIQIDQKDSYIIKLAKRGELSSCSTSRGIMLMLKTMKDVIDYEEAFNSVDWVIKTSTDQRLGLPIFLSASCTHNCLQTKCGWVDGGQIPILKPHLSNQAKNVTSIVFDHRFLSNIYKTNLFTKFHDDWAKNQTSRLKLSHVIQLTGTIFDLSSYIKETNVLTKFHENWAKNVTTIRKMPHPLAAMFFSQIWTIFELVRDINKTNVLTNFHDDLKKLVTSKVFTRKTAPPTGGHVFQPTETTF